MTGGDNKILSEKAPLDSFSNKTVDLSVEELDEAKRILTELRIYAEQHIRRQLDADDLEEAASSAYSSNDLELLRAYRCSVSSDFFDVFIVNKNVRTLREYGYTPISDYFTKDTEAVSQNILSALADGMSTRRNIFANNNADKICAYAMAHPDKAPALENFIRERKMTSFEELMALMQDDVKPSLVDGVL